MSDPSDVRSSDVGPGLDRPSLERRSRGDDFRARLLRAAMDDRVPRHARARVLNMALARTRVSFPSFKGTAPALFGKVLVAAVLIVQGDTSSRTEEMQRAATCLPEKEIGPMSVLSVVHADEDVMAPLSPGAIPRPPLARSRREPSSPSSPSSPTLAEEVAALDGVRASLREAKPEAALEKLTRYDHIFVAGQLRHEATVLRTEALEKSAIRLGAPTTPSSTDDRAR